MKKIIDNSLVQTKQTQSQISSEIALQLLKEGNARFVENKLLDRDYSAQIASTGDGQYPYAVILSCIDSRIPTEIVFDQGVGDVFNIRIAGNFLNTDILGSMEFSCKLAGAKLIVVMGHTSCGAIKGACDDAELGNLTHLLAKIKPALESTHSVPGEERNSSNLDFVNRVATKNVELTIREIHEKSPVLKEMFDAGEIAIVPAMYDVKTGKVEFYNN